MRRLFLALALLLPSPAWAAWSAVGTIMNANNGSGATSWSPTTSAALEAGNAAVCVIAKDETGSGTSNGDNSQFTTVTDAIGNVWTKQKEFDNMRTSTAADGSEVAVYTTVARYTLASGAAITFNFSASTTRKGVTCMEFTLGVGSSISLAAGPTTQATTAADPGSLSDATTVSQEHLFIRGIGCESNVTTYTADTDYTAFTGQGTNSTSNSGTAATSMGSRGEYRIANESTSAASDPTFATADCASVMIGLDEVTAAGLVMRQHAWTNSTASSTSVQVTGITSTGSDSMIVVGCGNNGNRTVASPFVTDSASNTYTQAASAAGTDATHSSDVYYAISPTSGVTTATCNFSGSAGTFNKEIWVWEVVKAGKTMVYDGGNGGIATFGAGTATGKAVVTTGTVGFLVGVEITDNAVTVSPAAGNEFTAGGKINASSDAACSLISSSAASHTPTWTDSGTTSGTSTAAWKEDTGAPTCAQSMALMGVGCR